MISAAFSAIIMTGACVCAAGMRGMTDASATLSPRMPYTCRRGETTPEGSPAGAILQVPTCKEMKVRNNKHDASDRQ